jgi:hypothetical protein
VGHTTKSSIAVATSSLVCMFQANDNKNGFFKTTLRAEISPQRSLEELCVFLGQGRFYQLQLPHIENGRDSMIHVNCIWWSVCVNVVCGFYY